MNRLSVNAPSVPSESDHCTSWEMSAVVPSSNVPTAVYRLVAAVLPSITST